MILETYINIKNLAAGFTVKVAGRAGVPPALADFTVKVAEAG
jgi:hypothetical protein